MEQNPILNAKLSMDSDIPLYAQLVGIIKRNISTGALAVGDLLPSEAELCRWMNISRNTVRQAKEILPTPYMDSQKPHSREINFCLQSLKKNSRQPTRHSEEIPYSFLKCLEKDIG